LARRILTLQPSLRWTGDRHSAAHQAEKSLTGSMGFASADAVVPLLKSLGHEPSFQAAFPREPATPSGKSSVRRVQSPPKIVQQVVGSPKPTSSRSSAQSRRRRTKPASGSKCSETSWNGEVRMTTAELQSAAPSRVFDIRNSTLELPKN